MPTSFSDSLLAGSFSGVVTRFLGSPLDLLKVRLQLQIEPTSPVKGHKNGGKYRGLFHAVKTIHKEEGIRAFWKGFLAGQALYVIYNASQFVSYEAFRKTLLRFHNGVLDSKGKGLNLVDFVSGFAAGGCGTLASFPFDVLRTRLVSQGEPKVYSSLCRAIVLMYHENGIRTFYKGLTPAMMSIAPQAGINFSVYNFLCRMWEAWWPSSRKDDVKSLLSGSVAGITSKITTLPLDIVKKRMEIQGFERAKKQGYFGRTGTYRNPVHCLVTIYKEEGFLAFFKGASPALLKATIGVSVSFTVYEKVLKILKQARQH